MLSNCFDIRYAGYRIKMVVAIERFNVFTYQNELVIPLLFDELEEARSHVRKDINSRLKDSMYFRSQKSGFDLVRYGQTASTNTYIAYRILPVNTSVSSDKV